MPSQPVTGFVLMNHSTNMNQSTKASSSDVSEMKWLDAEYLAWIHTRCEELSTITGWPVRFISNQPQNSSSRPQQGSVQDHCWITELNDGETTIGHLRVDLPEVDPPECSFQTMREMVELTGQLISECSQRQRLSVTYSNELTTLASLDFTCSTEMNLIERISGILDVAVQLSGYLEAGFFLLDPESRSLKLRVRTSRSFFKILRHYENSMPIPQTPKSLRMARFSSAVEIPVTSWSLSRKMPPWG
ncbi:MAG: hypothetical protein R3C11_07335 [Planctomycetaceae bacterium]